MAARPSPALPCPATGSSGLEGRRPVGGTGDVTDTVSLVLELSVHCVRRPGPLGRFTPCGIRLLTLQLLAGRNGMSLGRGPGVRKLDQQPPGLASPSDQASERGRRGPWPRLVGTASVQLCPVSAWSPSDRTLDRSVMARGPVPAPFCQRHRGRLGPCAHTLPGALATV